MNLSGTVGFMNFLNATGVRIQSLLQKPMTILMACMVFALINLFVRGSFMNLVKLHSDRNRLIHNLQDIDGQIRSLQFKIQQTKDPVFIERQAKDNLDMAGDDELVFVFSSD